MSCFPLFSVIVPVFNLERYIGGTLSSIVSQTCQDLELIVVDDGSTDGTLKICQGVARTYPQVVRVISQQNHGVSHARNTGIKASSGKYLIFVDGDDSLVPDTLEKLKLQLNKREPDVLYFDFRRVTAGEKFGPKKEDGIPVQISEKDCVLSKLLDRTIPAVAACYRRDMMGKNDILFDESLCYTEDALFFFTAVRMAHKLVYYPAELYYYLQRQGSATHSAGGEVWKAGVELRGWRKIKAVLTGDRQVTAVVQRRIREVQMRIVFGWMCEMKNKIFPKRKNGV